MIILSAFALLSALLLLITHHPKRLVNIFALQGLLLSAATLLEAFQNTDIELYFSALLTLLLKALLVPYFLKKLISRFHIMRPSNPITTHHVLLLFSAIAIVLFTHAILSPISLFNSPLQKNITIIATSMVLLGILMMITRHHALTHVIGFMQMENGLFFATLMTTQGMPMAVELGIAFDVLVALVLFGMLFFQIQSNMDSLNVDHLNKLREDHE